MEKSVSDHSGVIGDDLWLMSNRYMSVKGWIKCGIHSFCTGLVSENCTNRFHFTKWFAHFNTQCNKSQKPSVTNFVGDQKPTKKSWCKHKLGKQVFTCLMFFSRVHQNDNEKWCTKIHSCLFLKILSKNNFKDEFSSCNSLRFQPEL